MNADYERQKARNLANPITDDDPRHGTDNAYVNLDCRCQPCRDAWALSFADARARRAARLAADPTLTVHGSASTYTNWRCRCRPCTDAATHSKRSAA